MLHSGLFYNQKVQKSALPSNIKALEKHWLVSFSRRIDRRKHRQMPCVEFYLVKLPSSCQRFESDACRPTLKDTAQSLKCIMYIHISKSTHKNNINIQFRTMVLGFYSYTFKIVILKSVKINSLW